MPRVLIIRYLQPQVRDYILFGYGPLSLTIPKTQTFGRSIKLLTAGTSLLPNFSCRLHSLPKMYHGLAGRLLRFWRSFVSQTGDQIKNPNQNSVGVCLWHRRWFHASLTRLCHKLVCYSVSTKEVIAFDLLFVVSDTDTNCVWCIIRHTFIRFRTRVRHASISA